jgi:adenosylmethionine-8-amino-7-oxononanoate aminotransferase
MLMQTEMNEDIRELTIEETLTPVDSRTFNVSIDRLRSMYGRMTDAPIAVDAYGVYVVDRDGREYIDCASGTFDQPLGHRHPALVAAMRRQADELAYAGSPFLSEAVIALADKLVAISPPQFTSVHLRDVTGSTAIEGAIKIAQLATGKREIISLFGSHHGQTALTTDISGNAFRRAPYPEHFGGLRVPGPYCYRCFYNQTPDRCGMLCADRIDPFIEYASSGSIAAVIVEPIQGRWQHSFSPASSAMSAATALATIEVTRDLRSPRHLDHRRRGPDRARRPVAARGDPGRRRARQDGAGNGGNVVPPPGYFRRLRCRSPTTPRIAGW